MGKGGREWEEEEKGKEEGSLIVYFSNVHQASGPLYRTQNTNS